MVCLQLDINVPELLSCDILAFFLTHTDKNFAMAQQPQANNCNSVVIITEQPKFNSNETQETQKWGTVIESIIDNVSWISMDSFFFCILYIGKNYDSHSKNIFSLTFTSYAYLYVTRTHLKERL